MMECEFRNLSDVNFARDFGWAYRGTRRELIQLKERLESFGGERELILAGTIDRVLNSQAYRTFKCTTKNGYHMVTVTD